MPPRTRIECAALVGITNGAASVSVIKSAKCWEPSRPQFRGPGLRSVYFAERSRGVTGIEIVRRLLLPLRRHLGRRELGRAARPAEARLREIVLARSPVVAFKLGLFRHDGPPGSQRRERIGRAGRSRRARPAAWPA